VSRHLRLRTAIDAPDGDVRAMPADLRSWDVNPALNRKRGDPEAGRLFGQGHRDRAAALCAWLARRSPL
jgi:hypothetical protein